MKIAAIIFDFSSFIILVIGVSLVLMQVSAIRDWRYKLLEWGSKLFKGNIQKAHTNFTTTLLITALILGIAARIITYWLL